MSSTPAISVNVGADLLRPLPRATLWTWSVNSARNSWNYGKPFSNYAPAANAISLVPALGGSQRRISSFGYHPRWSPDGARILFDMQIASLNQIPTLYTTAPDGGEPRAVLTDFLKDFVVLSGGYVAWHPDSQRVSVWATHKQLGRGFWTVPVGGGEPVRSEVSPEVEKRVQEAGLALGRFIWSPSGRALYFEGASSGVTNLWKVIVDPKTLRWIAG